MVDGYGRVIDYLRLSVTDLCNLRCGYCMPPEGVCKRDHSQICSLEELAELARACVELGVRKIRLTGGEPLVRRGILSLVERLAALPGLEELTMTTNGTLLPPLAVPLREAGLTRLNLSLDSLRPDRYRAITRGGDLDRALAGLEAAERAGFQNTKINAVLLGGVNDDELGDLGRLAQGRPLSVRFIELMPLGPAADWIGPRFLPAARVLEALPELEPLEAADGVARLYTAPGWLGTVGLITPLSSHFCGSCSRIRITADGHLKLCLHSAEEIPLRGLAGEALKTALLEAVARKPERHRLSVTSPSQSARTMNRIGG